MPTTQCGVNFGDATLHVAVMGPEAYEAAGVPLPESAEEFSTRSGPQADVPEGTVFSYDDYGNYHAEFTRDGRIITTRSASARTRPTPSPSWCPRARWASTYTYIYLAMIELA